MRPNFFIVGAAKCGTTSLYHYLRQHPDVFMPYSREQFWQYKEPNFFCNELIAWNGLKIENLDDYLALFASPGRARRIGEASALNLYSKTAAQRIAAFNPQAKIIIMLRNPIEMMKSWHHDCLRWGHEVERKFEAAVALEEERRVGNSYPKGSGYPSCLLYRNMATFSPQVKRYIDAFGRSSVGIWLLEEMSVSPQRTFREIAEFLEVDTSFVPSFDVHNRKTPVTSANLTNHFIKRRLRHHMSWLKHVKKHVPDYVTDLYNKGLSKIARPLDNHSIDPAFLHSLSLQMSPEIDRLSRLIDKDLTHWQTHQAPALA